MRITSQRIPTGPASSPQPNSESHSICCGDMVCGSVQQPLLKRTDMLALRKPVWDPRFYANAELQKQAPQAFALMPEAAAFHAAMDNSQERAALAERLDAIPELKTFDTLSWGEKEPLLRRVFAEECSVLGMTPPELVIEDDAVPGPAFFDFNLENPDPGKVFLNPKALKKIDNGFAPLLLLMHETRHSAQFQRAFIANEEGPVADGFRAAYRAQRELSGYSFVDFTTLLNEYEAFGFANGVVETVTDGRVDTVGMGTLAGQYTDGKLETDLKKLFQVLPHESVLDVFNHLEKPHYEERNRRA
jgi:hypothetical protein